MDRIFLQSLKISLQIANCREERPRQTFSLLTASSASQFGLWGLYSARKNLRDIPVSYRDDSESRSPIFLAITSSFAPCILGARADSNLGRFSSEIRTLPAFKINQENHRDGNESSERTLGQAKQWPNRPCAKKRSGNAFRKSNRTERSARGSQTRPWHPLMITVSRTGRRKSSPGRLRI